MMRRGPLADTSIRSLLDEAASERITAVIELHSDVEGLVYIVDGEVYLADLLDSELLQDRLVRAGLLTPEQITRHTEPGDEQAYLGLALDTDVTIDEEAIADWLLDLTAQTLSRFEGAQQGEYEVDPYGSHPMGILASWNANTVYNRIGHLADDAADDVADDAADDAAALEAEVPAEALVAGGDADDLAHLPPPPGDADLVAPASPEMGAGWVLAVSDTAPADLAVIELSPVEWRTVVLVAQGSPYSALADRMDLDETATEKLVDALCERGLLTREE